VEALLNRPLLPYVVVVLLWGSACFVQYQLAIFNYVAGVSLLYFPAGIRTLTVFVLGFKGAMAIFVGSLLTMLFEFPYLKPTAKELLWAIGVAMKAVKYWKKIPSTLEGLTMRDVVYIVISQGLVSSTLHQLLFQFKEAADEYANETSEQALVYWAAMATGDILGSMSVLLTVLIIYQTLRNQR
jgi:hypothetical protein